MSEPSQPNRSGQTVGLFAALLLMPSALALLVLTGSAALGWGLAGIAATQVVALAAPSWLAARRAGRPAEVLALVRPPGRALVGAALLAVSYWYLSAVLIAPLVEHLFTEPEIESLSEQVGGPEPLAFKLLVIAIVPAVCEELLVRGAIARGLRPRLGMFAAALVSSAYFALLHGSLGRLPITFALGLVLAVATLRSGSLFPAVLIHAGNNAAVVLLSQAELAGAVEALSAGIVPLLLLPLAALLSVTGLAMVWRSGSTQPQRPW
ncbi:MAG TPA: type II CAAX endopeptidase family protein [Candidatus Acidoferrum sp.]|nr:type II CAAX endopeptidase family protein [Candidatus Acidoferrum sp.]